LDALAIWGWRGIVNVQDGLRPDEVYREKHSLAFLNAPVTALIVHRLSISGPSPLRGKILVARKLGEKIANSLPPHPEKMAGMLEHISRYRQVMDCAIFREGLLPSERLYFGW
jgi:hypothetical protein